MLTKRGQHAVRRSGRPQPLLSVDVPDCDFPCTVAVKCCAVGCSCHRFTFRSWFHCCHAIQCGFATCDSWHSMNRYRPTLVISGLRKWWPSSAFLCSNEAQPFQLSVVRMSLFFLYSSCSFSMSARTCPRVFRSPSTSIILFIVSAFSSWFPCCHALNTTSTSPKCKGYCGINPECLLHFAEMRFRMTAWPR